MEVPKSGDWLSEMVVRVTGICHDHKELHAPPTTAGPSEERPLQKEENHKHGSWDGSVVYSHKSTVTQYVNSEEESLR